MPDPWQEVRQASVDADALEVNAYVSTGRVERNWKFFCHKKFSEKNKNPFGE